MSPSISQLPALTCLPAIIPRYKVCDDDDGVMLLKLCVFEISLVKYRIL